MILDILDIDRLSEMMDKTDFWMWGAEGKYTYVFNRFFAFRFDTKHLEDDEIGWELAELLENNFNEMKPNQGETLILSHGVVRKSDKHETGILDKKYFSKLAMNKGIVTPFLVARKDYRNRWIKFPEFNAFINDDFISILYDAVSEEVYAENAESPIQLCGGDFFILPIAKMNEHVSTEQLEDFERLVESVEGA